MCIYFGSLVSLNSSICIYHFEYDTIVVSIDTILNLI